MNDTVPLTSSDIGPEADVIKEFEVDELGSEGYTQYFYHHEDSVLPVRDVTDSTGHDYKTEPCIERKAENYCSECIQHILQSFARDSSRRYLFLFTRCRNEELEQHYWNQYIVGYIDKRKALRIDDPQNPEKDWIASQGPMKLVSFDKGFPLSWIDRPDLPYFKNLTEDQTNKVLEHLSHAKNIYQDCLQRVEKLEDRIDRDRIWNQEPYSALGDGTDSDDSTETNGC